MEHEACNAGKENSDATDNVDDAEGGCSLHHIAFLDLCPLLRHLDNVDHSLRGSWLFHLERGLINLKQCHEYKRFRSYHRLQRKINSAVC